MFLSCLYGGMLTWHRSPLNSSLSSISIPVWCQPSRQYHHYLSCYRIWQSQRQYFQANLSLCTCHQKQRATQQFFISLCNDDIVSCSCKCLNFIYFQFSRKIWSTIVMREINTLIQFSDFLKKKNLERYTEVKSE